MQHSRSTLSRCRLLAIAAGAAALALSGSAARAVDAVDRARAAGEKQQYGTALLARLKKATIPYAVYARPPFQSILPESTPAPAEAQAPPKLRIFVCAEETEPVTLAVYAGKDLKDATLKVTADLVSESKQSRLPRTAFDIHVVKALAKKGAATAGGVTPELLIKDDAVALSGPAPVVRLTGDPRTDIPAGTSKQFWVTLRVPKSQPSAILNGRFVFSAAGVKPTAIPLTVEVLPMRLRTPFLQYGMDFRSRLSPGVAAPSQTTAEQPTPSPPALEPATAGQTATAPPALSQTAIDTATASQPAPEPTVPAQPTIAPLTPTPAAPEPPAPVEPATGGQPVVTPETFARQLADIRDHGFRFVSLYDPPSALAEPFRLLKAAGLGPTGPVIVRAPVRGRGDVEQVERLRAEVGLRPDFEIYYGLPDGDAEAAKRTAGTIHDVNKRALTVASVMTQAAYDSLAGILDVPVYGVTAEYSQRLLVTGRRENPKRDWWSWNIAAENKQMNRLYAGYLLYRTGLNSSPLYGAFAGPYQIMPGGDPYADPNAALVAYPAENGVLDTLQWEATREGVDDIRYITNLKTYIRELKDLKIRADVTDEAESFLAATMKKPLDTLPAGELQKIRTGVANRAIALLTILRQNSKRYPD